eukprot:2607-Heterococcus_DN1.PRE.2
MSTGTSTLTLCLGSAASRYLSCQMAQQQECWACQSKLPLLMSTATTEAKATVNTAHTAQSAYHHADAAPGALALLLDVVVTQSAANFKLLSCKDLALLGSQTECADVLPTHKMMTRSSFCFQKLSSLRCNENRPSNAAFNEIVYQRSIFQHPNDRSDDFVETLIKPSKCHLRSVPSLSAASQALICVHKASRAAARRAARREMRDESELIVKLVDCYDGTRRSSDSACKP